MITHPEFGRNVMVGTLFTDAHPGNGVVQDVFDDLGMELDNRNVNKVLLPIKYSSFIHSFNWLRIRDKNLRSNEWKRMDKIEHFCYLFTGRLDVKRDRGQGQPGRCLRTANSPFHSLLIMTIALGPCSSTYKKLNTLLSLTNL